MEKLKDAIFAFLNVFVIVALLIFILAGLMHIGIIEPPKFVSELFGLDDDDSDDSSSQGGFDGIGSETPSYSFDYITLDSENVKKMLYSVTPADSYLMEYTYTLYSSSGSVTSKICIVKQSDFYCAFYLSANGTPYRQIVRNDTATTVNTLDHGVLSTVSYPSGSIDFSSEIGSLLTHRDFFTATDDPGYTFKLTSGEYGSALAIDFTSTMNDYSQKQSYLLSLDYGVVTHAECFENDSLIYSLSASYLSKNLTPSFKIPSQFLSYLPQDFAVSVLSEE